MQQHTTMTPKFISLGNGHHKQMQVVRQIGAKDKISTKTLTLAFSKSVEIRCIWPSYPQPPQIRKVPCKQG